MRSIKKFFLTLLVILPAIFLWLVQAGIKLFANWPYFVYVLVVLVLSIISIYFLFRNGKKIEEFGKLSGKMLVFNFLLYLFCRSFGWIGPESIWLTGLMLITYFIMSIIGIFMWWLTKEVDEGTAEVMP